MPIFLLLLGGAALFYFTQKTGTSATPDGPAAPQEWVVDYHAGVPDPLKAGDRFPVTLMTKTSPQQKVAAAVIEFVRLEKDAASGDDYGVARVVHVAEFFGGYRPKIGDRAFIVG